VRHRCIVILVCLGPFIAACNRELPQTDRGSAAALSGVRDTLIRMGAEDQRGRDSIPAAVAHNDTAFMQRLARGDSSRSRWLQRVVATRGWPSRSTFGDTAAGAAWLIVQHSPMIEFQEAMLPVLEAEAREGEVKPTDVAMLSDRIDVNRNQPQRYGTQFSLKGGKLIADSIVNLTGLDSLRASVGLPPMKQYIKLMAQMYRMPVEWPPVRGNAFKR